MPPVSSHHQALYSYGGGLHGGRKMKAGTNKLTSLPLMLLFTASAFVVLAVSVVLMAAESIVSAVLPQATAAKKVVGEGVSQAKYRLENPKTVEALKLP